jgi:hypothetical protein
MKILERGPDQQRGWVGWRVRRHFLENNKELLLLGSILGYRWQIDPEEGIRLDTRGRVVGKTQHSLVPGSGSLTVGNKRVSVSQEGTFKITAEGRKT